MGGGQRFVLTVFLSFFIFPSLSPSFLFLLFLDKAVFFETGCFREPELLIELQGCSLCLPSGGLLLHTATPSLCFCNMGSGHLNLGQALS